VKTATIAQDATEKTTKIIDAIYDSKSLYGYLFFNSLDQSPILFAQVEQEIFQKYNLNDNSLEGSTFRITYGIYQLYPEVKDSENSEPSKKELIIMNIENIE
tara:strand:- start:431 stop:736 length:306 start_codon:yes stop_codon:yes gene_type:complete